MAYSPDFEQSMQNPVISKTHLPFPSSGVVFMQDASVLQAIEMGRVSNVEITPQEALLYKSLREHTKGGGLLKSDQIIMAEDVLTGERRDQFKNAFPHIFPPVK